MAAESQNCPKCQCPHSYEDGNAWVCPECFYEWTIGSPADSSEQTDSPGQFLDANGVKLETGDTIATVKDLDMGKEKLKSGTKAKNIRLLDEPVDGHDIACKIPGHGSIYLKCSVVKKIK